MRMGLSLTMLCVGAAIAVATPARAVEAPFEKDLRRLAELLGSLHYLRNLCGDEGTTWRNEMEKLLAAENPDEARRAMLVAHFNQGYRSFGSTYTSCTPAAVAAIDRFMIEGRDLTREIATRYGN